MSEKEINTERETGNKVYINIYEIYINTYIYIYICWICAKVKLNIFIALARALYSESSQY